MKGVQSFDAEPLGHLLLDIHIDDSLVFQTDDEQTKLLLEAIEAVEAELSN